MRLLNERRVRRTSAHPRASLSEVLHRSVRAWHGVRLFQPDWSAPSHSLALGAELPDEGLAVHLIMNAYWEPLDFEIPGLVRPWRRWIDTALDSPDDIHSWEQAPPVPPGRYHAAPRSVIVLWA